MSTVHFIFNYFFPLQKKLIEYKPLSSTNTDDAVGHKHLVHSSFKGWEHLNDFFLAVLTHRVCSMSEQRGAVLNAHLKFLQAFSVCIVTVVIVMFFQPTCVSFLVCHAVGFR